MNHQLTFLLLNGVWQHEVVCHETRLEMDCLYRAGDKIICRYKELIEHDIAEFHIGSSPQVEFVIAWQKVRNMDGGDDTEGFIIP